MSLDPDLARQMQQAIGRGRPIDPRRIEPPADIPPRVDPPEPPHNPALRPYRGPDGAISYMSFADLQRIVARGDPEPAEIRDLAGVYVMGQRVAYLDEVSARTTIARGEGQIVILAGELDAMRRLIFAPPAERRRKCR
jgi:hypothetical protein